MLLRQDPLNLGPRSSDAHAQPREFLVDGAEMINVMLLQSVLWRGVRLVSARFLTAADHIKVDNSSLLLANGD